MLSSMLGQIKITLLVGLSRKSPGRFSDNVALKVLQSHSASLSGCQACDFQGYCSAGESKQTGQV